MNEVKITYETLFDLLRREKGSEELQELDETFYSDVIEYLNGKQALLDDNSSQSDLFGSSETEKTRIQIQNIKKIIKELYERRERKLIQLGINKSKSGSTLNNTTAMLPNEEKFFEEMIKVLNVNRVEILKKILHFENYDRPIIENKPKVSEPKFDEPVEIAEPENSTEPAVKTEKPSEPQPMPEVEEPVAEVEAPIETADDDETKVNVKFIGAVPKFVGKKMEVYGPFNDGDTAELPKIIANILINKNRAEKI